MTSQYQRSMIATATLVVEALEGGKPATATAVEAFPRLAAELRKADRTDLADRLDAARAKMAADLAPSQVEEHPTMTTTAITFTATVADGVDEVVVKVEALGVTTDRGFPMGYVVPNRAIAARLVRAIEAGAVFYDAEVRTDVNGKTYVTASSRVLARMVNADLKRLGF